MHFNIQGLTADKILDLEILLTYYDIDICCLTEHHWQGKEVIETFNLVKYKTVSSFSRTNFLKGGVCILAKNTLNFNNVKVSKICEEKTFEICCAQFNFDVFSICVFSIYRSPKSDFSSFLTKLSTVLEDKYNSKYRYVICGDVNVNFLPSAEKKDSKLLANLLAEFNIKPTIFCPTRITDTSETCIDNIFTDIANGHVKVCDSDISDHTYQILSLK